MTEDNKIEVKKVPSTWDQAEVVYSSLTSNEQFGLAFGLFPAHLAPLSAELAAALIGVGQAKHRVTY